MPKTLLSVTQQYKQVIPAQAGIHPNGSYFWIPACAGMTFWGGWSKSIRYPISGIILNPP